MIRSSSYQATALLMLLCSSSIAAEQKAENSLSDVFSMSASVRAASLLEYEDLLAVRVDGRLLFLPNLFVVQEDEKRGHQFRAELTIEPESSNYYSSIRIWHRDERDSGFLDEKNRVASSQISMAIHSACGIPSSVHEFDVSITNTNTTIKYIAVQFGEHYLSAKKDLYELVEAIFESFVRINCGSG